MRRLLIVEGPDCAGKTTLAKYLARTFDGVYMKCHGAMRGALSSKHFENILSDAKFNMAERPVIIDRHWPSEYIYAPLSGREPVPDREVERLDKMIRDLQGLYILCRRSDVVKAHAENMDSDHPYDLSLFKQIVAAYEVFGEQMYDREDAIVYNYDIYASKLHKMAEMVEGVA